VNYDVAVGKQSLTLFVESEAVGAYVAFGDAYSIRDLVAETLRTPLIAESIETVISE
jgi:hypothetical protein